MDLSLQTAPKALTIFRVIQAFFCKITIQRSLGKVYNTFFTPTKRDETQILSEALLDAGMRMGKHVSRYLRPCITVKINVKWLYDTGVA